MNSVFSLEGKAAIVTGASKWTGGAIAAELAKAGADVAVAARTVEGLEAVAGEIRQIGRRAVTIQTDVTKSEDIRNMVQKTVDEFGKVDILVNVAGSDFPQPALEVSEKKWELMLRLNLTSHFLCSQAVAPIMIKQGGGCIVDISSAEAYRAAVTNPGYSAAKAGLLNLVMSLAAEWGQYNIRVNAIAPGFIDHPYLEYAMQMPHLKAIFDRIPLGRGVRPEEIGAAVVYLASDAAACVTGITVPMEGGMISLM